MRYSYLVGIGAGIILGLIFVFVGLDKLSAQSELFAVFHFRQFLTPTLADIVNGYFPWVELALGLLLIIGFVAKLMASFSLVLIAAFIGYNSWMIAQGRAWEPCGCFGIFERMFRGNLLTIQSLSLDIVMLALVVVVFVYYPGDFLTIRPWFLKSGKSGK